MDRSPRKMNLSQLSERTGFSSDKIDLLIQEGLVSDPQHGFTFTSKHQQELENIRKVSGAGYEIVCERQGKFVIDQFVL